MDSGAQTADGRMDGRLRQDRLSRFAGEWPSTNRGTNKRIWTADWRPRTAGWTADRGRTGFRGSRGSGRQRIGERINEYGRQDRPQTAYRRRRNGRRTVDRGRWKDDGRYALMARQARKRRWRALKALQGAAAPQGRHAAPSPRGRRFREFVRHFLRYAMMAMRGRRMRGYNSSQLKPLIWSVV